VDIDGQQGPSKYTRYHDTMAAWNRWTGLMDWNTGKKPFLDMKLSRKWLFKAQEGAYFTLKIRKISG